MTAAFLTNDHRRRNAAELATGAARAPLLAADEWPTPEPVPVDGYRAAADELRALYRTRFIEARRRLPRPMVQQALRALREQRAAELHALRAQFAEIRHATAAWRRAARLLERKRARRPPPLRPPVRYPDGP